MKKKSLKVVCVTCGVSNFSEGRLDRKNISTDVPGRLN